MNRLAFAAVAAVALSLVSQRALAQSHANEDDERPASGGARPPKGASASGRRAARAAAELSAEHAAGCVATEAHAEPEAAVKWYGWQTLLSDGAALALLSVGGEGPALAGVGVFALGAPSIHVANGQVGKAFGSLGLRVAPTLFAFGAIRLSESVKRDENRCASSSHADTCEAGWSSFGASLGVVMFTLAGVATGVTAVAVDASLLAKKEARPKPSFSAAPVLLPARGGAIVALGGAF